MTASRSPDPASADALRGRDWRVRMATGALVLAALALISHAYWLFPAGTLPSPSRDLNSNLLPIAMYKAQVAAGQFPWASPWYSAESNFHNPLWNFLYPPATLLFLALPIVLAVRVVLALHILLGWYLMRHLLAAFTEHEAAAFFGAFLYVFSGLWAAPLTSYHFEKIFGLAWLPLALLLFRRCYEQPAWRSALALGATLALLVYAGAMYLLVFTLAALAVMAAALFVQARPQRRQAGHLALAAAAFVLLAAPKLLPNLLSSIASARPSIFLANPVDLIAAPLLPGDLWPISWPETALWRWNEVTVYISTAGLALALLGSSGLWRGPQRRWLFPLLAVLALMIYWSMGFPPFAFTGLLAQLRVASRGLMIVGFLLCILAAVGLDALIRGRVRVPGWLWGVVLGGLFLEMLYVALRGDPAWWDRLLFLLPNAALSPDQRQEATILLWLTQWQPLRAAILALISLLLLGAGLWSRRVRLPLPALILAALTLFAVMTVMAAPPLESAADPLQDAELGALRAAVGEGAVAFAANIGDKDVRGRVELGLAGQAHLINPYYGSFGQDVTPAYLDRIDYLVSARELHWDAVIVQHWSPFAQLRAIPQCALQLIGQYHTQDPLTRNDLAEIESVEMLAAQKNASQTLFLYRIEMEQCAG